MLRYLRISNLAVISDLEIEFEPGLNLLTGETGSGKSIIVDSLALLLGVRASPEVIRTGAERAFVEGIFRIGASQELVNLLAGAGVDWPGEEILIRREVQRGGPSRAFVNDRLVTVSFLRELRPFCVDIHGQGDHQTLLFPAAHLQLIDAFAGAVPLREELNRVFRQYRQKRQELDDLIKSEAERLRLIDVYQFQIAEIEKARLQMGEDDALLMERKRLQNAERLQRLSAEAYRLVYEDDHCMLSLASEVGRRLEQLREVDGQATAAVEQLGQAKVALEEVAFFLRDYADGIEFSPSRLQRVEERLAEIDRLKRKYGPTVAEVLANQSQMALEFERLGSFEWHRTGLEKELQDLEETYTMLARQLTEQRKAAARTLETVVMAEMRELAMERGQFVVAFHSREMVPAEHGVESVEFLISTNPGEDVKPLAHVASGGELSRLMLAIKSVAAEQSGSLTLVFDEIDVGIGGRVAEQVGLRLKRLAGSHQVFCVTHQPQIARFAHAHYRVQKRIDGEQAAVLVERLGQRGRIEELARMLAGAEITDVSRKHARELLKAV
jgi:DNA repair protein RecN (Recombination protein N)